MASDDQYLIRIRIQPGPWRRIERLAHASGHESPAALIETILDKVQQGVYRSGSRHREWLEEVLGVEPVAEASERSYDEDEDLQ